MNTFFPETVVKGKGNSSERKGEQYLSFGPNNSGSIHDSRDISLEHFCLDTQA